MHGLIWLGMCLIGCGEEKPTNQAHEGVVDESIVDDDETVVDISVVDAFELVEECLYGSDCPEWAEQAIVDIEANVEPADMHAMLELDCSQMTSIELVEVSAFQNLMSAAYDVVIILEVSESNPFARPTTASPLEIAQAWLELGATVSFCASDTTCMATVALGAIVKVENNLSTGESIVDLDVDGIPQDEDCDDTDASSTVVAEDGDCDGALTDDDCDDADASSTVVAEDGDCDGVLTDNDCDDSQSELGAISSNADCDAALADDDCDDNDAELGAVAEDGDCDGVLTDDDCDDNNVDLGTIAADDNCDGFLNDFSPSFGNWLMNGFTWTDESCGLESIFGPISLDDLTIIVDEVDATSFTSTASSSGEVYDCDRDVQSFTCATEIFDTLRVDENLFLQITHTPIGAFGSETSLDLELTFGMDCDGNVDACNEKAVELEIDYSCLSYATASASYTGESVDIDGDGFVDALDCDDGDASLGAIYNDMDCDGVLTDEDCDDEALELGAIAADADCDGVLTGDDCSDVEVDLGAIANDADCDGVLTANDCDDGNAALGDIASDGDCDGVLFVDDCDDASEEFGAIAADADCDGVLAEDDCSDSEVGLGASANDADCDGALTGDDCDDEDADLGDVASDSNCDGIVNVEVISVGYEHACGLDVDGVVQCWGGQLRRTKFGALTLFCTTLSWRRAHLCFERDAGIVLLGR